MKIGVAVVRVPSFLRVRTSLISSFSQGGMTWGSYNVTAARTQVRISRSACSPSALTISLQGGVVRNNVFKSGSTGYFGYAIAVAGHVNADVTGNDARRAAFGGSPSWQYVSPPVLRTLSLTSLLSRCIPNPLVPLSQAFVYDSWTTSGALLQPEFVNAALVFLICSSFPPASLLSLTTFPQANNPVLSSLSPSSALSRIPSCPSCSPAPPTRRPPRRPRRSQLRPQPQFRPPPPLRPPASLQPPARLPLRRPLPPLPPPRRRSRPRDEGSSLTKPRPPLPLLAPVAESNVLLPLLPILY